MIPEKAPARATTPWRRSAAAESTRRRGYDALDAAVPVIRFLYPQPAGRPDKTLIYQRNQLTRVIGMDVPGRADAWASAGVYEAEERPSGIFRKPAAAAGLSPMAMNPQANVQRLCGGNPLAVNPLQQYERWHQRPGQRAERRTAQHDGPASKPGKVSPMRHNDRWRNIPLPFQLHIVFHFTKSGKP